MFKAFKTWLVIESHINDLRALGVEEKTISHYRKISKLYPRQLRGVFYSSIECYVEKGYSTGDALDGAMSDVQEIINKTKLENEMESNNAPQDRDWETPLSIA